MTSPLANERLQFFLRHRDEIKEWASIEREVMTATRELLAGLQVTVDERIAGGPDPAQTVRHDGGRYERIMVRRETWPVGVGATLEWEPNVDPIGGPLPKFGIFFLTGQTSWGQAHGAVVAEARASAELRAMGYKPGDGVWPIVQFSKKSPTWWQDPDAWLASIADPLVALWPVAAPMIDRAIGAHPG